MNILLKTVLFLRDNASALKLITSERLLLIHLAGRIGQNDYTWIKQKTLAEECGFSPRHLRTLMAKLQAKELVKVDTLTTKKGEQYIYKLGDKITAERNSSSALGDKTRGTTVPLGGGTRGTTVPVGCGTTVPVGCGTTVPLPPDLSTGSDLDTVGLQDFSGFAKATRLNKQYNQTPTQSFESVGGDENVLPDFIKKEDWDDFVDLRKRRRCPITPKDKIRIIESLRRLHENGQNISDVINQSIVNVWTGVFPVRGAQHDRSKNPYAGLTRRQETTQRAWDMLKNWT